MNVEREIAVLNLSIERVIELLDLTDQGIKLVHQRIDILVDRVNQLSGVNSDAQATAINRDNTTAASDP